MDTLTVRELANGKTHSADVGVYVWRDGDVVFYVGQSSSVNDRLLSYLGHGPLAGWGYGSRLYTLLRDNFPAARDWQIDVYAPEEIALNRDSMGIVNASYLREVEDIMIHRLRPCLNATNNKNGLPLPARYAKEKIANDGISAMREDA